MEVAVNKDSLYCAMLQLACFIDDYRNNRPAFFGAACAVCKIKPDTCDSVFDKTKELAECVGVDLQPYTIREVPNYKVHLDK